MGSKEMAAQIKQEMADRLKNLGSINLRDAPDEVLERLKQFSDDELLRASTSVDLFAIAESMRRLKIALHREEVAIKWLTVVLTVLTLVLVLLGIEALRR